MSENAEYFISHLINHEAPLPSPLERWPLHMTVVPPFHIEDNLSEEMILKFMRVNGALIGPFTLSTEVDVHGSIPLLPGERDMYGEDRDIEVVKITDPTELLHDLHKNLTHDLGRIGCSFIHLDPRWSGDNYHPHASTKSGDALRGPFFCNTLSLHKKSAGQKSIAGTVDMYNQVVL